MNIEDSTTQATDEQRFIRDALAAAEKAERFQRIKLIVVTAIAFGGCFVSVRGNPVEASGENWWDVGMDGKLKRTTEEMRQLASALAKSYPPLLVKNDPGD